MSATDLGARATTSRARSPLLDSGTQTDPANPLWISAGEHASFSDLAGKVTGHGAFGWHPTQVEPVVPPQVELAAGAPAPVLVLLDGHVKRAGFVEDVWTQVELPDGPVDETAPELDATVTRAASEGGVAYPSHYGHATFIVGLVRQVAPSVKVLSVPVARGDGHCDEADIHDALTWLAGTAGRAAVERLGRLAVVLVAAGRRVTAGQARTELAEGITILEELRSAVVALGTDVTFVTSAGNWGTDERAYPAWFAQDLPNVVAVGALDHAGRRASFSSWGDWVTAWETGTDVVSCLPLTVLSENSSNAAWSGTSFAAAIHAGRLAQARADVAGPPVGPLPVAIEVPAPPVPPDPSARI